MEQVNKKFELALKRANSTEVISCTFRCMEAFLELREAKKVKNNANGNGIVKKQLVGEIFPKEALQPLWRVRKEVSDFLATRGVLIGKSGAYVVPVKSHQEISEFLKEKKTEFNRTLSNVIDNYDEIVKLHLEKLANSNCLNADELANIKKLIPSKSMLQEKHTCSYIFYSAKIPAKDDLAEIEELISSFQEQDKKALEKIWKPFAELLSSTNGYLSSFLQRSKAILSQEQSMRLFFGGSQYEDQVLNCFSLIKKANSEFSNLSDNERRKFKNTITSKVMEIARVISGLASGTVVSQELFPLGWLNGQIELDFQSAPEMSQQEEEGVFDDFLQQKADEMKQKQEQTTIPVKEEPNVSILSSENSSNGEDIDISSHVEVFNIPQPQEEQKQEQQAQTTIPIKEESVVQVSTQKEISSDIQKVDNPWSELPKEEVLKLLDEKLEELKGGDTKLSSSISNSDIGNLDDY